MSAAETVPGFDELPPEDPDEGPPTPLRVVRGDEPPASLRDLAFTAWRELREARGAEWDNATEEERAAFAVGRIVQTAGLAESLARAGYTGPGAAARYLADVLAGRVEIDAAPREAVAVACSVTVADLEREPPREQLAHPYIARTGTTIIYGKGGTGKGVTAAYLITRLVRDGIRVYVVDFENHPDEWAERLPAFGLCDDELRTVAYRTPYGDSWPAGVQRGPLVRIADYVREDAAAFGAGVVLVDSYTTATSTGDTNGGADAAQEFANGGVRIGLPLVVLAHVPKTAERFPPYPFGSVFAHNLARMTWAVEAEPPDDFDPANPYAPSIVRLELRNQKRNRGARVAPRSLTFSFFHRSDETLERIEADEPDQTRQTVADMAARVLEAGPLTVPEIRRAVKDDYGRSVDDDTIRKVMARDARRFAEDRTGKRPYRWSAR